MGKQEHNVIDLQRVVFYSFLISYVSVRHVTDGFCVKFVFSVENLLCLKGSVEIRQIDGIKPAGEALSLNVIGRCTLKLFTGLYVDVVTSAMQSNMQINRAHPSL